MPEQTDGISLWPLFQGRKTETTGRSLVWHFPNFWGPLNRSPVTGPGMGPSSTIIMEEWKLIYYHENGRFELFNLELDPGEKNNLSGKDPWRVRQMAEALTRYLRDANAPMPVRKTDGRPVPMPAEVL